MGSIFFAFISAGGIVWIFGRHIKSRPRIRFFENLRKRPTWRPQPEMRAEEADSEVDHDTPTSPPETEADISQVNRAFRIGEMHFARADFDEAEQWFIKVLSLDSDHAEALNRLGVIYIQQGNPRRAEILYRKLFSITQKEAAYYCNYGRCLYNQKRLSEAVEAYENAVKLDATKASRFVSIGQIYYEQKNYMEALENFVRALGIEPQNIDYLKLTAQLAELVGDTDRLHKSLKKLGELEPYDQEIKEKMSALSI